MMRKALAVALLACVDATHHTRLLARRDGSLSLSEAQELAAKEMVRESSSLLVDVEADLRRLIATTHRHKHGISILQLGAKPANHSAKVAATPAASKPTAEKPGKKGLDAGEALQAMSKLGVAQMPAMEALMKGMYESWKDKIGAANRAEAKQKADCDKNIADLEKKRIALNSKEADETYFKLESYWKKQRALAHRQYHTALKIMHTGMAKFKSVEGAMDDAVKGKKPSKKDLQVIGATNGAMPDIVFVQLQSVVRWAKQSLKDATKQ